MSDFPWRKHSDEELLAEYLRLKIRLSKSKITFPILFSRIGYKCSNNFFQYERMNTAGYGRPSTLQYWKNNKKDIISFSKQEKRDLFSTLNYFNHAPSQFPIVTAGQIYKYFNATKILDPYAGWGDRCLAAMSLNVDYIGIDSNPKLKKHFTEMKKFFPTKSNIKIISKKAEDVNINKLDFDFVFSSPPFWRNNKLLELYNNTEDDYKSFFKKFSKLIDKCLKKDVWVCLYIPKDMCDDLVDVIGKYKKTIKIKTSNSKKIEYVYCWKY